MSIMTKKLLIPSALILSMAFFLSGCVTDQNFRNLSLNVRNQDTRLVGIENQLGEISTGGTTATQSMQKQQASLAEEMESLSTKILQLQGQLDETTHRGRALKEENNRLQEELDNRLLNLETISQSNATKISELIGNISALKAKMAQEAEQRAQEALHAAQEAQRKAAVAAATQAASDAIADTTKQITPRIHKKKKDSPASAKVQGTAKTDKKIPHTPPSTAKSSAEKLYDMGLDQYRSEDFKGSITTFTSFLDQYKGHKLVANARFWLGSSLLKSGDYSGAVLEFQNIVADYPGHPKAPEALLKQAKAFEHFGDKMVQKKLYKDILTYYPDSEQAKKAKKLLDKLK